MSEQSNEFGLPPQDKPKSTPKQHSRRWFLETVGKAALAGATGVVAGESTGRASEAVVTSEAYKKLGDNATNAAAEERFAGIEKKVEEDPEALKAEITKWQAKATTIGPVSEEFWFRAVPSRLLSGFEGREDPYHDVLVGTGEGLSLSRREALVGAASSVAFGLMHNFTSEGYDAKKLPLLQIASGGVYFYLQRKLGFASNVIAHAAHNNYGFRRLKQALKIK